MVTRAREQWMAQLDIASIRLRTHPPNDEEIRKDFVLPEHLTNFMQFYGLTEAPFQVTNMAQDTDTLPHT